jgi:hypothetical protein
MMESFSNPLFFHSQQPMQIALLPGFHSIPAGAASRLRAGVCLLVAETRILLALDAFIVVLLALAIGPFLASLLRHADSAMAMAAILDDDALISMQLDGMTAWPWGNPANYLDTHRLAGQLPPHWGPLSYTDLPYYGGLYLDLALLLWAPLKLLGLPFFPTAPVILRALAHLFTALFLLAGYNLVRVHFNRVAAVLATFFIASEFWLYQIGVNIHPDSLLFFLMVLQLHLCIRHAQGPRAGTVVALAIVAGLAQGAKMGGPALVPMTVLALAIARRDTLREQGWLHWLGAMLRDGLGAAAVALAVFFVTTPYALVDPYFFRTWLYWAKVFSGPSPISPTTFSDWWSQASGHLGAWVLALALAGVIVSLALRASRERWIPQVLLLCLGLTVFLYYALFQKYWVQLQYLVVAYWVVGAIAAIGIGWVVKAAPGRLQAVAVVLALAAGLAMFATRFSKPLFEAFLNLHWRESPQYAIGAWAERNLPTRGGQTSLLSDAPTYFPVRAVPRYTILAAPVRYLDLATYLPDYFVLTRYFGNWQTAKITGTHHEPWDADTYNMRLYQDLTGTEPDAIGTGKALAFAQQLHAFGRTQPLEPRSCDPGTLACAPITPDRVARLYDFARQSIANGRYVSLYRLDKEKFIAQMPDAQKMLLARPLASSTAGDASLASVLRGSSSWRSDKQGLAATGEFVGFELPAGSAIAPRELTIRWVAVHWLPLKLAVDHSDDGKTWTTAIVLPVKEPAQAETRNTGTNRWDESFALPAAGAHRFWRVRAAEIAPANFFGLERLSVR